VTDKRHVASFARARAVWQAGVHARKREVLSEEYCMLLMAVEGVSGWGGHHGECGARAYNGGLAAETQVGSRAEPVVRGSGGEAPLKLKAFWSLDVQRSWQI